MRTILYEVQERQERWIEDGDFLIMSWFDPASRRYQVMSLKKEKGGIRSLVRWYEHYDEERIKDETQSAGIFSPRPYTLGQPFDESVEECCCALYVHFCRSFQLDPVALYRQAYQPLQGSAYLDPYFPGIIWIASWQGITYPAHWGTEQITALLDLLLTSGKRRLVAALAMTPPCRRQEAR